MLYYVLISVVILAEIIIAVELFLILIKVNKKLINANIFFDEAKPKIKDIARVSCKISEQLAELAPFWVRKFKMFILKIVLNNLKSMLMGFLIFGLRQKFLKDKN